MPFFVFDSVFSAIADTLVLPYTITMQAEKGSIDVN
ncbi:YceK/YidQ family lipoprotein [Vibrio rotiferianus]